MTMFPIISGMKIHYGKAQPPAPPVGHSVEEWFAEQLRRGERERFAVEVQLTPELAGFLLERNEDNRVIRQVKLAEMVRAIVAGRWDLNGEPLIISTCGKMNDGQHRCHAVLKSGGAITVMMMFGFARETRRSLDQGGARSVGDVISMSGVNGARDMGSAATRVLQYDKTRRMLNDPYARPGRAEILEFTLANDEALRRSVEASNYKTNTRPVGVPRSLLAALHFLFARVDPEAADVFIKRTIDGADLSSDSPIYRLRDRLTRERNMPFHNKADFALRAWRLWRAGEAIGRLQPGRDPRGTLPEIAE
jgi:hypothetical protein